MFGVLESVKGMIKLIKKEISSPNTKVFISGGFADIIDTLSTDLFPCFSLTIKI